MEVAEQFLNIISETRNSEEERTSRRSVLEMLTVAQLVKEFKTLKEPKCSLPWS